MTNNNTNNNTDNKTFLKGTNNMTTKIKNQQTVLSHGFKFDYTPSMHCMGVHYPNGRLEIIHCLYGDKWRTVINDILTRHGSYKRVDNA